MQKFSSDFNTENGVGRLRIHRGGELIALTLSSEGDSSSSIVLGGVAGSGEAKLAVDERATLMRNLRIIGPHVEFTPLFLDLTPEHVLTAEITGPEHSTIKVLEEATLNDSALHVDFSGYTPTFDDSWTLLDAFAVLGEFGSISANGLPPGAGVFLSYASGGENGEIVDLTIETQLDLSVNRRTGAVAIENRAASETVSIQGYTIDGITGGTSSQSATLAPMTAIDLGNVYEFTPTTIGEEGPAVTFEYEVGGETIPGRVEFTGPQNNIVLLVDPETGSAALQNQSDFDADVDGYSVISSSGSLDAVNWTGLGTGWQKANPSNIHLAELNLTESLVLNANGSPIGIGSPFDFDADGVLQDLAFEFHLNGGDTVRGIVEYGTLDLINPLDCDGDGVVSAGDLECILRVSGASGLDALILELGILRGDLDGSGDVAFADFLILSANFGTAVDSYVLGDVDGSGDVAFADFLTLSNNFGKSAPAAASVPEPAGWWLIGLGWFGLFRPRVLRRSHTSAGQSGVHRARPRRLGPAAMVLAIAMPGSAIVAQTLTPVKQIFVSDTSDRDMVNADMNPGPLDDSGDIVARERRTITQDNIQIRTFMEFDLSSITTEAVANPGWSAQFVIDFVTRLNTVNDMTVVVGRVLGSSDEGNVEIHPDFDGQPLGDAWTTEPGQLPLFEWGRTTGESTAPDFEEDRLVVVENVKTDPLGTRQVDVTDIVANWVNGVHDNNGFSIAGGHDEFQGAGLNNARLIVGIAGDFDGNGTVDLADFLILANNFSSELDGPVTAGDIDFDGDVDLDDFGQFKAVFLANAGQAQAVPEPATLLTMAGGLIVGLFAVRRRRKA